MSEDNLPGPVAAAPAAPAVADVPPSAAPTISIWPAAVLREQLRSADPAARVRALAQAVQPTAPLNECIDDLVHCATLCADDPLALRIAAIALGCAAREQVAEPALLCLASLTGPQHDVQVRIAATHSLYRQQRVPAQAFAGIAGLLVHSEMPARKIAALALGQAGTAPAGDIAAAMAAVSPAQWTTEGLAALVASAGDSDERKRAVEQFVLRGMRDLPLVPGGVAAYAALARLGASNASLIALLRIAIEATEAAQWHAALDALGALGPQAASTAPELARALENTDDPEREEALCRVLVQLRPSASQLPFKRMVARVAGAPDRAVAAHCMLLTLHAKEFAAAARAVASRFGDAGEALRKVLSKTHELLTGVPIEQPQAS